MKNLVTRIKANVKTDMEHPLRWYHTLGLAKPKCPKCNKVMEWEMLGGYSFVICEDCQIIRD